MSSFVRYYANVRDKNQKKMKGKNLKIHGESRDSTVGADKDWEQIL